MYTRVGTYYSFYMTVCCVCCDNRQSSKKNNRYQLLYRGADKSLDRPTSRCILFEGEDISFDASLVIYINNTNIPPIVIINRIYETQNLLTY